MRATRAVELNSIRKILARRDAIIQFARKKEKKKKKIQQTRVTLWTRSPASRLKYIRDIIKSRFTRPTVTGTQSFLHAVRALHSRMFSAAGYCVALENSMEKLRSPARGRIASSFKQIIDKRKGDPVCVCVCGMFCDKQYSLGTTPLNRPDTPSCIRANIFITREFRQQVN